jgi:hypothetical protein
MSNTITSVDQLKRAIVVAEQIEKLQAELSQILGGNLSTSSPTAATPTPAKDPRKGKRSPAVRARMAAAQKARWAKKHAAASGSQASPAPAALASAPKAKKAAGTGKSIPLSDLKVLLEAAPGKTLNVRKQGLQLANLKTLTNANPHLLKLGGKGAWPTITMLK